MEAQETQTAPRQVNPQSQESGWLVLGPEMIGHPCGVLNTIAVLEGCEPLSVLGSEPGFPS